MLLLPWMHQSLESSASMNATLLNHFREEDNTDQTYSQEDLEYENTLRALEQDILK